MGAISRIIHQFYVRNEAPTLKKILLDLKDKMNFPYSRVTLWRLLRKMGFSFRHRGRERIVFERADIIAWRQRYVRQICEIRNHEPSRAIIYTDESWLNKGHKIKKEWIDLQALKVADLRKLSDNGLSTGCTKKAIGKGKRLFITDAMTKDGPLTGALTIFRAYKAKKSSRKGRKGAKSRPIVSTGNEDKKGVMC